MDRRKRVIETLQDISLAAARMTFLGTPGNEIINAIYRINSSQKDLDRQVEEAVEALGTSTRLISELEGALEGRAKKLQNLQIEYERVSKLAEITGEQGNAIAREIEKALGRGQIRERWIGFAINIGAGLLFFLLGVFASDWVKSVPDRIKQSFVSEQATEPITSDPQGLSD